MYNAGGIPLIAKRLMEADCSRERHDGHRRDLARSDRDARDGGTGSGASVAASVQKNRRTSDLNGTLAPEGWVVKVAGDERMNHRGPARVSSEKTMR